MSPTINLKALPLHRILALAGATLMAIALFLPWQGTSGGSGLESYAGGVESSVNGWRGVGKFAGYAAILVVIWEIARLLGRIIWKKIDPNLPELTLTLVAAICGTLHFFDAISGEAAEFGISYSAGLGAYGNLLAALTLYASAFLALQATQILRPGLGSHPVSPPPPPPPDALPPPPPPAGPRDM